ncbi:hypothetical protein [Mucilaginibacter psychrotolerans]|uniref:Uncharacterized protein n=1 Tax=Mucilaginibacter psychrotolerans TaxID=1524096 RepID=A0A4Y8SJK3_9SPHI|nr:hypothetical protein [Mucilaginibacter psychrotolerans]TFF39229.1 hypothetical protein E2R66_06310 [Mucilaginibacter psychrotolerans]
MQRLFSKFALITLLCISVTARAQLTDSLVFESLQEIDTIDAEQMRNYADLIPFTGGDVLLAKAGGEDHYRLIQKYSPDSWIVYELPEQPTNTADCVISGQFIIYHHQHGNSTRTSTWWIEDAFVIDTHNHAFFSLETGYKLEVWDDPPVRRKKETDKQYEKRVDKSTEVKYITNCLGSLTINVNILTVSRKCKINGLNISPIRKTNNEDWLLQDVGTYRYKYGVFYRVTTVASKPQNGKSAFKTSKKNSQ